MSLAQLAWNDVARIFEASYPNRKRPAEATAPAHEMRTRSRSYNPASRSSSHRPNRNADNAGSQSRGPQGHQNKLKQLENRLKSVQGDLRRLKEDHKRLQDDHRQAESVKEVVEKVVEHMEHNTLQPYARKRRLVFDDTDTDSLDVVLRSMLQDALAARPLREQVKVLQRRICALEEELSEKEGSSSEVERLRDQVAELQNELLAKLQVVHAVSDEHFARDFRSLASLINTLSRRMNLDETVNVSMVLKPAALIVNVPSHHWKGRLRSKIYIEAWIWAILFDRIFQSAFAVFGKGQNFLDQSWKQMFGSDHEHGWPQPSTSSELWRCTTAKHLMDAVGGNDLQDVEHMIEGPKSSMLEAHVLVVSCLHDQLDRISSQKDLSSIQQIVDKACALATQMSNQQSRLQITFPALGAQHCSGTMTATLDSEGEEMTEGSVAFVINPGLSKWGDAHGKGFDQRYEIVPCLVQLEGSCENVMIKHECD